MDIIEEGAKAILQGIQEALDAQQGFLAGRFGTIECNVLDWLANRPNVEVPEELRIVLERNAGVFPFDVDSVKAWGEATKEAFQAADSLAVGWYAPTAQKEKQLLGMWGWNRKTVALRSLEPYYVNYKSRWTQTLNGRKVCVVSSFAETASQQIEKAIWDPPLWSDVQWSFVRTGYAPSLAQGRAGWEESPSCWQEAVEWTVGEVLKTGAEIVVIGCGGLGMAMGARLKAAGKICLVLGGATQVLFGIKGERWRQHTVIGKLWNSEWVWPSLEETPAGASEVEGACYWLKNT
jgi:hypothetical protein